MTYYRATALAATQHCLDVHMRAMRFPGPVQKVHRIMQPIELTIGTMLSLPELPAQIEEFPDPLWLGIRLVPPLRVPPLYHLDTGEPAVFMAPTNSQGIPERLSIKEWMAEVARVVRPGLPYRGNEPQQPAGAEA